MRVQGHVATVTSTLLYVNGEERPLEAVFVFPLPGECALCHFSAKLGDTEVVAKLQDKQKVRWGGGGGLMTLIYVYMCNLTA